MYLRSTLFVAAIALVACDGASSPDTNTCSGAKCDGFGDDSQFGKLMPGAPATPASIELTRNEDQWLFELIGDKGVIVLLSQDYSDRASAINGALSVEENGVLADRYRVSESAGGFAFELVAGNGEVIAESQVFASENDAEAAAEEARDLVAGYVQYKAALTDGAGFALERSGSDWEFELLDEGSDSVLRSQLYSRRRDAIVGIESVRENGKKAARYVVLDSPPRFILKARNGKEIGESSTEFASVEAAQAAADALQVLLESERVANPW